jgi:vacuolar-type H+-ATPase subunit C/Vma6
MAKKNTIESLASLVAVRNHIVTVLNDRNVCQKSDYQLLGKIRVELDKKFITDLKELVEIETLKV